MFKAFGSFVSSDALRIFRDSCHVGSCWGVETEVVLGGGMPKGGCLPGQQPPSFASGTFVFVGCLFGLIIGDTSFNCLRFEALKPNLQLLLEHGIFPQDVRAHMRGVSDEPDTTLLCALSQTWAEGISWGRF